MVASKYLKLNVSETNFAEFFFLLSWIQVLILRDRTIPPRTIRPRFES